MDQGRPTALYTGVEPIDGGWRQTVCVSQAARDLGSWRRHSASPVISGAPTSSAIGFRDPFVWNDGDGWAMVIGSGTRDRGGSALLYRSGDLLRWQYVGPILEASDLDLALGPMGLIWECPQLVPIRDRHLQVYSLWDDVRPDPRGYSMPELHHAVAIIGDFDGRRFTPTSVERLDHGPDHYAPAILRERDGRLLMWGWSWEALTDVGRAAQGWAGALTLPRVIGLDDGRLTLEPAPELSRLRSTSIEIDPTVLGVDRTSVALPLSGDLLDIEASFRARDAAARFGLVVRASRETGERTAISFDCATSRLTVDRRCSSRSPEAAGGVHSAPIDVGTNPSVDLRVIVDRSVIEVFANRQRMLTVRVYPTAADATEVLAFAEGGEAEVTRAKAWELSRGTLRRRQR